MILVHVSQAVPDLPHQLRLLADQGARGVQLFFVVSALTLMLSWHRRHDGVLPFYIRRLFRIAPVFWLAIAGFLLLDGFDPRYWAPHGIDWRHVLATLTFQHGWHPATITSVVPGGWTIAVEMTFYAMFPIIASVSRRWWHAALLFVLSLLVFALPPWTLKHSALCRSASVLLVSAYGTRAATGLLRITLIVVAGLLTYLAIKAVPLQGLVLLKVHYPNSFAGLVFFYWMRGRFPVLGYVAACAVFVTIAPFWHRLHPLELTNGLAFGGQIDRGYNLAVALSGTLTALGGARLAATKLKGPALAAVTFVGKRSLDIYALHFYLLAIWPPVAGAILASLAISAVLRLNRWSSMIFFGEPASSEADRLAPKTG